MVLVCLNCGCRKLTTPPTGLGTVPGRNENAGIYYCKKCGWVGFPIDVESEVRYRKHLKKLRTKRVNKRKRISDHRLFD
ncbi:hypothetical protein HY991_05540 [Candidatus Micrarchaeota archaeon]|nr:hypothetical protein [Candidatus Micrarchaeota archaeon]